MRHNEDVGASEVDDDHGEFSYVTTFPGGDSVTRGAIEVADRPKHIINVTDVSRTFDSEHEIVINGLRATEERDQGFVDTEDGAGRSWGYVTIKFGDEGALLGTYDGAGAPGADGVFRFSGVTTITGGAGRQAGVRGQIRYSGHIDPADGMIVERGEGRWWRDR